MHILHLVHGKNAILLVQRYENIEKLMPEKQKMFSEGARIHRRADREHT